MSGGDWVSVPRMPTFDMLRAAENVDLDVDFDGDECDLSLDHHDAEKVWQAMLRAAPKPPTKAQP